MDSLTHTLLGACMGELIAGRQIGKKAMLFGALVHNCPDLDVIAGGWLNDTEILLAHRGITHSIAGIVLLTPLLAWFLKRLMPGKLPRGRWLLFVSTGLLTHIVTDAFTTYGTGWFEPFSHYRVSFNTLFILDPFFMLPVLVGTAILFFAKQPARKVWAGVSLMVSGFYLLYTIGNKMFVLRIVEKNVAARHIHKWRCMAAPTPLNNFLWYVVIDTPENYWVGYYSLFDKNDTISFSRVTRNDSLLVNVCNGEQVNDLLQFTKGYYHAGLHNDTLSISDLRFGQVGGWDNPDAPFVFKFVMPRGCNGTDLKQGTFEDPGNDVLGRLFERIRGR